MSWGVPSFAEAKKLIMGEVEKNGHIVEKPKVWKPIVDEKVEARFKERDRYIAGKVVKVHDSDTYDINYVDGGKEVSVKLNMIKKARITFNYKVFAARTTPSVLDFEGFVLGRVMVDFEPVKAFQLPLKTGDIITIVAASPEPHGWSKAIDESGQCGFYPTDHVRIIEYSKKIPFFVPMAEETPPPQIKDGYS